MDDRFNDKELTLTKTPQAQPSLLVERRWKSDVAGCHLNYNVSVGIVRDIVPHIILLSTLD